MAHTPGEGGVWKVFPDKESRILKSERKVSVVKAMSAWVRLLGKEMEPVREPAWLKHESDGSVGLSKPEGLRLEHGEFPWLLEQVCTTSVASTADACSPVGLKPRCRQSHAPSALQGSILPSLFPFLVAPSSPWLMATSPQSLPLSSRGLLSPVSSSLPVRTPVTGCRVLSRKPSFHSLT